MAEEKIKQALTCDFYLANYASGSLFVSRFAGIKGLSHLNNNMNREHHIHHFNTELPSSIVTDVLEDGKVGHHVSYSIKVDDFIKKFSDFFNSLTLGDLNFLRLNK